ncbi:MAG: glycosyltransferase family 4 protein [Sulfuricurvum sp.]|jgi:alpha-1,3-rhamnosyl/mannosyltransferase|uniref:glycosyltransferase family 4 protein n=1 Tax=Sulfuricurvum sp. TaxID=2025608 RepID=UPI0025E262BE|nr:glycosyltransferase family 1 protein [Sulfuricurvum sp.]MCK9374503.1 glycosyltransferase family 4 protein [Sulfuricurvum sp.]
MRLIVNCSPLRPPLTGIGHYTRELLLRLIDDPAIIELEGFFFHRWLTRAQIRLMLHDTPPHVKSSSRSLAQIIAALPGGRELYRFALRQIHKKNLAACSDWLYWETNYIPLPFLGKTVTTVYDLSHIRYPQFHPDSRVSYFNSNLQKALEKSVSIVTISEFSAREMVEYYKIDRAKLTIIPPGVSEVFHPYSSEELAPIRDRYGLPSHYLLSVATLEPRKNFKNLCLAYAALSDELRCSRPLVIVGASGWLTEEIEVLISPLAAQGQIIRLGYIPGDVLPLLYAAADALCYVSFYEGYGMPIAEAIASGIPVLTSDCTSMPEVGGNRAWYANPASIESIYTQMSSMIQSDSSLFPPSSAHLPSPKIHSWDDACRTLVSCFRFSYNSKQ